MNRICNFLNSQHGLSNNFNYDFSLKRLCVAREDSWRGILPSDINSDYNPDPPIFAAKFANCDGYRHMLAIANEDGKIALQDTTKRNMEAEEKSLSALQCHYNAVFDLEWAPGLMKFVSASGDHTARLWEIVGSDIRSSSVYCGHTRSVKTAAFRKNDSAVFATGGRDGAIVIWDTRARLNVDMTPRADNWIHSGHVGGPGTPISQRRRTRTPKLAPNTTSSSITGLVFQDANTLISCGAGDGVIKVWDLRRNYSTYKKEPHPKYSLPYAGSSSSFKGYTNLLIDSAGARLYANCMDNTIYCYNLCSYSPVPLAKYKGLLNSTFYIKSCLSPDGKYLLSGSSDEKAYIWNLDYPDEPLVSLSGHTVEVTCVAWGASHDRPIVTCSEDARHKIWRIGPENITESDRQELYRGNAEYVRQFGKRLPGSMHKYNLRDLESTPRSLKRLVEQNERTPGSMEKISLKRSFLEMLGAAENTEITEEPEQKRIKTLESRGRRLFGPIASTTLNVASCSSSTTTSTTRCLNLQLSTIPEESMLGTAKLITSPLSRNQISNDENASNISPLHCVTNRCLTQAQTPLGELTSIENYNYNSPPSTSATTTVQSTLYTTNIQTQTQQPSSMIFSPTSNLPNYVIDGEAPHLGIMSPKRKAKDKIDWLTKIRKQKLMSSCRGTTLSDKMNDERTHENHRNVSSGAGGCLSSPRLQSLRNSEGSPRLSSRRRISHTGNDITPASPLPSTTAPSTSIHHPKTPTSRRNSETTILRFFSKQNQEKTQKTDDNRNSRENSIATDSNNSINIVNNLENNNNNLNIRIDGQSITSATTTTTLAQTTNIIPATTGT